MLTYNTDFNNAINNANLILYINGIEAVLNAPINVGDILKIEAKTGYLLSPLSGDNRISDFMFVVDFEIAEDKKSGTLNYASDDITEGWASYTFTTTTAPIEVPDDNGNPIDNIKKGVNNVYLLDANTARQVMNKRFTRIMASGEGKDYAETIIGLINIPFAIDDKYKTGEQKIMLADFDTQLTGVELNTDTIIVDMGVISVPHLNNDFTDYEKTEVNLFLPFCDSVTLKSSDVVGYDVTISYWVNCYNGETLINIYSSKNNALIESRKVDLRVSVPFNKMGSTPSNNAFNQVQSVGYNGVNTPYIELKTLDNVLKNGLFTNPVIDEKTLTDEEGYIEVENIELTVNAMLQEKTEILNLLRQGVIIK